MADTIDSGTLSYSGTLTASTAFDFTTPDRWNYVAVTNGDASSVIYATSDGSTASASNGLAIPPGKTGILANQLPYWNQSRKAIQLGAIQVGNGSAYNASTNPSTPTNPGTVTPMEALDGKQIPDPGTSVSLFTTGTGVTYSIQAAG